MFPLARFRIEERSMSPDLDAGDYVIVNTWAYRRRGPDIGDLVVLRDPEAEGRFLCKWIAGALGSGLYAVRGYNEAMSRDSRSFGPVPAGLIVGKVWLSARADRRRTLGPESPS
ncbi:MAG: S26 family signal peptidase [Methanobacteriota archaeon]|nr:MAG: S26 family signal peptidase [Euryarchaeota archaeon]